MTLVPLFLPPLVDALGDSSSVSPSIRTLLLLARLGGLPEGDLSQAI